MYKLQCKNLGTPECDYVAKGETSEEVVRNMKEHARSTHPDKVNGMSDADLTGKFESEVEKE
jgi:predicted small metal-binding protein